MKIFLLSWVFLQEQRCTIDVGCCFNLLPSPLDVPDIKGVLDDGTEMVRKSTDDQPFSALAFKIMTDPFVGRLTFFRVYSGTLNSVLMF